MSSVYVRQQIKQFLEAESDENVLDLTGEFEDIKDLLADSDLQPNAPWLGLEFIGDEELPIALAATNDQGKYREFGSVFFHVVAEAQIGGGDALLARGEVLQNLFRGRRIGDIAITGMTMMNFSSGATLQFEGGYMSGSFQVTYQRDNDL